MSQNIQAGDAALRERFNRIHSTPQPFGDECQWYAVSKEIFPTKEAALQAFRECADLTPDQDEAELILANVKSAWVQFDDDWFDEGEGAWFISQGQGVNSFAAWAFDPENLFKEQDEAPLTDDAGQLQ